MFYQTEFIVMKKLAEINSENLFPAKKRKLCLCNFWEISIKSVETETWTWNQTRRTWPSASCPELGCHRRKPWSGRQVFTSFRSFQYWAIEDKQSCGQKLKLVVLKRQHWQILPQKILTFPTFYSLIFANTYKKHCKTRWHNCSCVK